MTTPEQSDRSSSTIHLAIEKRKGGKKEEEMKNHGCRRSQWDSNTQLFRLTHFRPDSTETVLLSHSKYNPILSHYLTFSSLTSVPDNQEYSYLLGCLEYTQGTFWESSSFEKGKVFFFRSNIKSCTSLMLSSCVLNLGHI